MKKKFFEKSIAWICAITMFIATLSGANLINVNADTTTTLLETTDEARPALIKEIENANYNFALGKTATVSKLTTADGGTNLGILTNGKFATGNSKDTIIEIGRGSSDNTWLQVDLGSAYDTSKIDRVAVQYKTNNSGPKTEYLIQYSLNGIDFIDVADVKSVSGANNGIYLDKLTLTETQKEAIPYARYVRIYSKTNTTAYGLQVKGIAVLTDGQTNVSDVQVKEIEELDNPTSLNVTSSDYEQLEYTFEKTAGHDDYTYYAFVDGTLVNETVLPDTEYTIKGLAEGKHEVKIVAYKDGLASVGISKSVEVKDFKSLLTDERNVAIGKTASSTSKRDEAVDFETNITDGKTNTLFRTAIGDLTADIVIDLGKSYKKDAMERIVMLFAATRYSKAYTVEYSKDGNSFEQVANVTGVTSEITNTTVDTSSYTEQTVQYVRIHMSDAVAVDYGFQIYEVAIVENYIDMSDTSIEYTPEHYYTDEQIQPEVNIKYNDTLLTVGKDYTITYGENKAVGTGTFTVTGIGKFTGTLNKTFNINKQNVSNITIDTVFNNNNELVVSAKNGNKELEIENDYTYTTDVNTQGNLVVTVTGKGDNYTGTAEKIVDAVNIPLNDVTDLSVTSDNLNEIIVKFSTPDKTGAKAQTYNIYIDNQLVEEKVTANEYRYLQQTTGPHNVKVVALIGERTSSGVTQEVSVSGIDISSEGTDISMENKTFTYSGETQTGEVKVKYNDSELIEDKDYTVEFSDNINAGTAKYKVTGIGIYEGSVEGEFTILSKKLSSSDIVVETSFDISKKLVVTVKDGNKNILRGTDYNYIAATDATGNITITVTGLGKNYEGTVVKKILSKDNPNVVKPTQTPSTTLIKVPTKAKINKIATKKKSAKTIKLTLKKIKGVKGYQIRITKTKNGKKAVVSTYIKKTSVTIKSKKLKGNKTLYVKARAYKLDQKGKKVYGKWSDIKKVKIKK